MSISAMNLRPADLIAVAVQESDGSCLIVSEQSSGARPDFPSALAAAAEDAAATHRGILIPHQSIPALRRLLMGRQAETTLPPFLR